nr:reverse transcriptase domain-containing protein [Tanacetum cinerariifolium]
MIPTTSSPPKVVERETEVIKDTVPPTNNGSTKDVQPSVVQIETQISNSEPVVAPVVEPVEAPISALKPNPKSSIPYPPINFSSGRGRRRCLRKSRNTGRALIDVYEGELTEEIFSRLKKFRVGNKAATFNLDQTSKYSANYDDESINRIDIIDVVCEEYSQKVLGFSDSDFLHEETDAFLTIKDEPISLKIDNSYYDSEGDILLLEEFLNDDLSSPPLPPRELKVVEPKNEKSSIDKPPVVELKDLPPNLEYAFLEGDDKLPVIIAKDLNDEEKTALIKVLKSHKQALAWKLSDIKGINQEF